MYQIRFCAQARICFPSGSAGKESACNTRSAGGVGSIPGSGRAPGGMATQSSIFASKIPWTEGVAGYSPWGRRV